MAEDGYAADLGFGRGGTRIWISLPVRGSSTTTMTRSRRLNGGCPRDLTAAISCKVLNDRLRLNARKLDENAGFRGSRWAAGVASAEGLYQGVQLEEAAQTPP